MHQAGAAALSELLQFPAPGGRAAQPSLSLRPPGQLSGIALQAGSDRRGRGRSLASLLPVPALPHRPIPRRCRTGHREHGVLSRGAPHAGGGGPGGPLRSRPPADETAGRSGGDHQSRGAHGGSHRRRYRRARAGGDPAGHAVGSADRGGRTDSDPVCANGWDRSAGGEERDGGPAGQDGRPTGPYAGSQVGMRVHPDHVGQGRLPDPRSRFHHLHRRHRNRRRVWQAHLSGSLEARLEPRGEEGRHGRWSRMDLESCRAALSRRHSDCRSLSRAPAPLGVGAQAVPQRRSEPESAG